MRGRLAGDTRVSTVLQRVPYLSSANVTRFPRVAITRVSGTVLIYVSTGRATPRDSTRKTISGTPFISTHFCAFCLETTLAPELLSQALHVTLPHYTEVRIDSADLTNVQPAEYRADHVILLLSGGAPVLGIVLEVQLGYDEDKRYAWPSYVSNLRARVRCPVCLLVITAEESVARWAKKNIELGGGNCFTPWVLSLANIPEISDEQQAKDDPELAVLSAMAHATDPDTAKSARIALWAQIASAGLEAERSMLYCDLILNSLPEAARRALQAMSASKYEYQSEFARRYYGQGQAAGQAEGKTEGRLEIVLKLLSARYGVLSAAVVARVRETSATDLERIAERVLTAQTLDEALSVC